MNINIVSVQMTQKIFATIAVLALVFSPFTNVQFALADEHEKVTICHATESGDAENIVFQVIHTSENAIQAHFNNSGSPNSGHEDDILLNGEVSCPGVVVPPNPGTITIVKQVSDASGNDVDFNFTSNVTGHTAFTLQGGDSRQMLSQDAGIYTISESAQPQGWSFSSVSCSGINWQANGSSVTVTLTGNDDVTCTFINTMPILGCTDESASNYNPNATDENGSCTYDIVRCTVEKQH